MKVWCVEVGEYVRNDQGLLEIGRSWKPLSECPSEKWESYGRVYYVLSDTEGRIEAKYMAL